MQKKTVTPTALKRPLPTSITPAAMNNVANPIATPTVGGREMKSKTVTPSALNNSIHPSTVSTAPNRVAKPGPTNSLLEKRDRTGAKAIVRGPNASVPHYAVKTDAAPSGLNKDVEPSAATAVSKIGEKAGGTASEQPKAPKADPKPFPGVAELTARVQRDKIRRASEVAIDTLCRTEGIDPTSLSGRERSEKYGDIHRKYKQGTLPESVREKFEELRKLIRKYEQDNPPEFVREIEELRRLQAFIPKSASDRKKLANLLNAQKSTGPKTQRGKMHSRTNSFDHGMTSRLLITEGEGAEDPAEFHALLEALRRDLAPVGTLENLFVGKIAICFLKQKRCLLFENGSVKKQFAQPPFARDFEGDPIDLKDYLRLPLGKDLDRMLR